MADLNPTADSSEPERPVEDRGKQYARFVRGHGPWLFRYTRWLGLTPIDAEDVVQDVFVAVLQARSQPRGEAQLRSFLRETARRISLATRRKNRSMQQLEHKDHDALFMNFEEERDQRIEALRACLEALPQRQHRALEAFYGGGESRRAIATRLGLAVGGLKSMLARSKQQLRACIERRLRSGGAM